MRKENLDYLKPQHREWWLANTNTPPTVILVCGIDGCDEYVGEVKTDKADTEIAIALIYNRFGDRTVPYAPLQTSDLTWAEEARDASGKSLADVIRERKSEYDNETLRTVGDGKRVAKRYTAPALAMSLDLGTLGFIVCPKHAGSASGFVALPDPDSTVADLRRFIANTKHASRRRYWMFRGSDLS